MFGYYNIFSGFVGVCRKCEMGGFLFGLYLLRYEILHKSVEKQEDFGLDFYV